MGLICYKTVSSAGAPHDDATLSDGPGRLGCPFRAYSFLGTVFPWRCHGLKEKCPLRGVRVAANPCRFSEQCGTIRSRDSLRKSSRKMTEVGSFLLGLNTRHARSNHFSAPRDDTARTLIVPLLGVVSTADLRSSRVCPFQFTLMESLGG